MRNVLIIIVLSLVLSACGRQRTDANAPSILLIIPTATHTAIPIPTATEIAIPTSTPLPTSTPTPSPKPLHLVFGVFEQEPACQLITKIVSEVLEENIAEASVETIQYDRRTNELFTKLAARKTVKEIDLTFCFYDPQDRIYLRLFLDEIKQIGATLWQNEGMRMLIMANVESRMQLKQDHLCVYKFLQKLNFGKSAFPEQDVDQWVNQKREVVRTLLNCEVSSPAENSKQ